MVGLGGEPPNSGRWMSVMWMHALPRAMGAQKKKELSCANTKKKMIHTRLINVLTSLSKILFRATVESRIDIISSFLICSITSTGGAVAEGGIRCRGVLSPSPPTIHRSNSTSRRESCASSPSIRFSARSRVRACALRSLSRSRRRLERMDDA